MKDHPSLSRWVLLGILSGACTLYLLLLDSNRFGAYHDDGIYVTTAKALATHHGYHILSLPYEPAQTKYPPFYPFLLSLIWRLYPSFPENVPIMMLFSVAAALTFLILSWSYLVRYEYASSWQALVVVGLSAFNWRTAVLAVDVLSEMTFAAISVLTLCLAERCAGPRTKSIALAGIGALAGITFLTRSSGMALLFAIGCYLGFRRQWYKGLCVLAVGGLFVIGWFGWCYANKTSVDGVTVAYYTSYMDHLKQILADLQRLHHLSVLAALAKVVATNFLGLIVLSIPIVSSATSYNSAASIGGHWLVSLLFLFLISFLAVVGMLRHIQRGGRLLHLYVISYLIVHLFWLPTTGYDRFLMPVLPFLLLFILSELSQLALSIHKEFKSKASAFAKGGAGFVAFILIGLAGIVLLNYGRGLSSSLASRKAYAAVAEEDAEAAAWIKAQTRPEDVIVCYRDPKYYLYTGRKSVRSFPVRKGISWNDENVDAPRLPALILQIMGEADGRYLVLTSSDFEYEEQPEIQRREFRDFLHRNPRIFVPAFQGQNGQAAIFRIEKTPG